MKKCIYELINIYDIGLEKRLEVKTSKVNCILVLRIEIMHEFYLFFFVLCCLAMSVQV